MTSNCQCGSHPPAKPQAVELAKLEAVLADCKRRKKAAGVIAPAIACLSESLDASRKGLAVSALTAKLQAVTAQAKADLARITAKTAAAAVVAPRPPVRVSGDMSRSARREAARIASTFSAGTAGNFADSYVADLARHASTSPADREVAKAELARRGILLHANGNTSRSTRKA